MLVPRKKIEAHIDDTGKIIILGNGVKAPVRMIANDCKVSSGSIYGELRI